MRLPLSLVYLLPFAAGLVIDTGSLQCEGVTNPLGIHVTKPRLSWRMSSDTRGDGQTAYQVQASSSNSFATPDLWDSGKTAYSKPYAQYDGKELRSRQSVYWRARLWDLEDGASEWSEPSMFEIGLLSKGGWSADWITNPEFKTGTNALPMFAKEFDVACDKVDKARLYITGLGVFAAEINGRPVSTEVLGPGYSTINRTILYRTYDVTELLRSGTNVVGAELGKGTYDAEKGLLKRYQKFTIAPQPLVLKAQLEYTCANMAPATVGSDDTWVTTVDGPLLESSWYGGEEFDARRIIKDWSNDRGDRSSWKRATLSSGPPGVEGDFFGQVAPQLKITEIVQARSLKQAGSQWVYDMGVNYAGWFTFTMDGRGRAGERIVFYPAENVTDAGAPDQESSGRPIFDGYTLAGLESESFTPKFMYHGNQYIGVNTTWEPKLSDMTGYVIRADNEVSGTVKTSNSLFNQIHQIIERSVQGNMHSVLTDCPTREKLGWLEQDHLAFETVARSYDIFAYGHDFMLTMADAQAVWGPKGLIPATAPEYVVFAGKWEMYRSDPNWGNAIMRFPLKLWEYYGDRAALETYYPIMEEYMEYLTTRRNSSEMPVIDDGIGLADWETIDHSTPNGLTDTYAYQQAAAGMKQIAKVLRKCSDASKYAKLEKDIQGAFHKAWFNTTGGKPHYGSDSQASNALALDMGSVPAEHEDAVFDALLRSLERERWHFTVGEIGIPALFRVLMARGRNDVLFTLMNQRTSASYGYQIEHGATSLWEHWDGNNEGVGSLNHFMYGFPDMWINRLSGLAPAAGSSMWNRIEYAPIVVGDLTSASASYRTPAGFANASWTLDGSTLTYDIVVPVGANGLVSLNGTGFTEGGKKVEEGNLGIRRAVEQDGVTKIEVGSGTYSFKGDVGGQ